MRFQRLFLLLAYMTTASFLAGQLPSMIVEIHGKVAEVGTEDPVISLPLNIDNYGRLTTDLHGLFQVPVPYSSGTIRIDIEHPGYEILNPPDGTKLLSQEVEPNSVVNINIWVLGAERNDRLMAKIEESERLIQRLKKKDELTQRQIEQLNETLLDTIDHYEVQTTKFERKIKSVEKELASSRVKNEVQSREIATLSQQLQKLQEDNEDLLARLTDALEEKYFRQKGYYDDVTRVLNTYHSRLKDLRDQLAQIEYVFKSKGAQAEFVQSIKSYSTIYEELNGTWSDHANAVSHYWESQELKDRYLDVKEMMLADIHQEEVLPLNTSVITPIRNASTGRSHKPKKTKKAASEALAEINQKIDTLEPMLDSFLKSLADF